VRCTKIIPQYMDTEYYIGTQQSAVEVRTALIIIITIILYVDLDVILIISCISHLGSRVVRVALSLEFSLHLLISTIAMLFF
jgi:hypothetical protein